MEELIPYKTQQGELILVATIDWSGWDRVERQVFALADGHRSILRIANLLHQQSDTVTKACSYLIRRGYLGVRVAIDISLLRKSIAVIPDRIVFARTFYSTLFQLLPECKELFEKTDWDRQYGSLMATLSVVINGAESREKRRQFLELLGARHKHLGVHEEYYPIVKRALMMTFDYTFGKDFTPHMRSSWTAAIDLITTEMLHGADTTPD